MTDNLPVERPEVDRKLATRPRDEIHAQNRPVEAQLIHSRRPLPRDAYIRPGLGDLPLSAQVRAAFRLLNETLMPLIDSIEHQQPQVVQCSICYRNLGGWPEHVLEAHYWQHTWLQRKLAKIGIR